MSLLTLLGGDQYLSGVWITNPNNIVGNPPKDINGVVITVGAVVKFVGQVLAINTDPHYGSIFVNGLHPNGSLVIFHHGSGPPISQNFPTPNPQTSGNTRGFEPLQLIVGS